jgi:hypothetical protein
MTYTVYLTAWKNFKFKVSVEATSINIAKEKAIARAPSNLNWQVSMIWRNHEPKNQALTSH